MPLDNKSAVMLVHAACVAVIAGCFVLAGTVLEGQAVLGWLTVGVGTFLWGKLGFKPAKVILERLVFKQLGVELVDAKRIVASMRPPAGGGDLFDPAPATSKPTAETAFDYLFTQALLGNAQCTCPRDGRDGHEGTAVAVAHKPPCPIAIALELKGRSS